MGIRSSVCLLLLVSSSSLAAPATSKKGAPDAYGTITYWVKCDNGNVTTTQCFRDQLHCGERIDVPLPVAANLACDSMQGLIMEPIRK